MGSDEGGATAEENLATPDEGHDSSSPETPPTSIPSSPAISEIASLPARDTNSAAAGSPHLPQPDISEPVVVVDNLNRTHTRMITYPVGESIVTFKTTRELVEVIRDAIKGHKALLDCGLLHRDISATNILLATGEEYKGFIHDLDYSTKCDKFVGQLGSPSDSEIPKDLTERTGAYQFMARGILKGESHLPMHVLESFYWLLTWSSVRHVEEGDGSLDGLVDAFDIPEATTAVTIKQAWLHETTDVRGNKLLTQLLPRLAHLLLDSSGMGHDSVLRVFKDVLNSKRPGGDECIPF